MKWVWGGTALLLGIIALEIGLLVWDQKTEVREIPKIEITPTKEVKKKPEIKEFPFTAQAPTGDWENSMFQDGCEETSVLMVYCAFNADKCRINNGVISPIWAEQEIIKMSEWEQEKYGSSTDTAAQETADRLLNKYFGMTNFEVRKLNSSEELKSGIWIFPMDGQKVGNPNYTAPGPERHMILVIGYDAKTDEIITNDAGTRRGRGYRYKRETFWKAIRDYPTGDHEPIMEVSKKGILILSD